MGLEDRFRAKDTFTNFLLLYCEDQHVDNADSAFVTEAKARWMTLQSTQRQQMRRMTVPISLLVKHSFKDVKATMAGLGLVNSKKAVTERIIRGLWSMSADDRETIIAAFIPTECRSL